MAEPMNDNPVEEEDLDSGEIDWSNLSDSMDPSMDEDILEETPEDAPETEAEAPPPQDFDLDAAEPEPAPKPEAQPQEPEPIVEEVVEETPPPPTPQPEPVQTPQAETPRPEQKPEDMARLREQWVESIAQGYKLSDEDANNLIADPNSVLPALAANLHASVYEAAVQTVSQMVQQMLPQYLETWTQQKETTQRGENTFFEKWPELKEHKGRVMSIAQVYRGVNPEASMDQFIQDVGVQTWMAVGLPPAKLASKLNPEPAPQAPQKPRSPSGYRPAPPSPAAPPQPPGNPFSELAEGWFQEDM